MSSESDGFRAVLNQFVANAATDMARLCLAAVRVAAEKGSVTADDLRCVELKDENRDKRIFGGALAYLMRAGVLVTVGTTKTQERGSNSRPIGVYALTPDWRSQWLKKDGLPPVSEVVDLQAPRTVAASRQVGQDEVLGVLAEVNRLARAALSDQNVHRAQTLDQIRELTARWGAP